MNKLLLTILLSTSTFIYSQTKDKIYPQDTKKHELKFNMLNLFQHKMVDASYEYLLNETSSFGIATAFRFKNTDTDFRYKISPFYRHYFSNQFARGIFVEGFGTLFSKEYPNSIIPNHRVNGFSLGIGTGIKLVSKKGFTLEANVGVGRSLFEDVGLIYKSGISAGFRF